MRTSLDHSAPCVNGSIEFAENRGLELRSIPVHAHGSFSSTLYEDFVQEFRTPAPPLRRLPRFPARRSISSRICTGCCPRILASAAPFCSVYQPEIRFVAFRPHHVTPYAAARPSRGRNPLPGIAKQSSVSLHLTFIRPVRPPSRLRVSRECERIKGMLMLSTPFRRTLLPSLGRDETWPGKIGARLIPNR